MLLILGLPQAALGYLSGTCGCDGIVEENGSRVQALSTFGR